MFLSCEESEVIVGVSIKFFLSCEESKVIVGVGIKCFYPVRRVK